MKAVLLGFLLCLSAMGFAAAQPEIPSQPGPGGAAPQPRLTAGRLSVAGQKLKANVASRIQRSLISRHGSVAAIPVSRVIDTRLTSAGLQRGVDAMRLKQIQARKNDPQFMGVIDSMMVGGTEIALERRRVRTSRGVQTLLLNRVGNEYIYDGDLVVPPNAIEGAQFSGFSAGVAGTFGRGSLWDDAIIPFETESSFCCQAALADAIAFYEANTKFRFVPRDGHETYVRFINAEPFTDSRTGAIGKQHGENAVRIQGTSQSGQPLGLISASASIQHEIGHVLGLIHEHLRSDRDKFIARNPKCTPADIFQSIRQGWEDVTNSSFTDDSAELLSDYDFASRMHYMFLVDSDGDGALDCTSWVRIADCPNRDPTAAACRNGNFSSLTLSLQDIEGLNKLYARVVADAQTRTFTGDNVRHRGRRIDRCLHGASFGEDGCSAAARGQVGDEFCRTKGFQNGFDILTRSLWGEHSGFDKVVGWKNVWGADVISSIVCKDPTTDAQQIESQLLEARTFTRDEAKVSDRPIDRCVHGDGIDGDRCSNRNQRRVADRFCELRQFDRSSGFKTDFAAELNSTGFFPSSNDFRNVSSLDIFTEITCVRT